MPRLNKLMTCSNCRFYEPCTKTAGECRIEPPRADAGQGDRPFPTINANDYCRVFAPNEETERKLQQGLSVPKKPGIVLPGGQA